MTVLEASGQDPEERNYRNMLGHWISYYAVRKACHDEGLAIPAATVQRVMTKKIPKEEAAQYAYKLLCNKRVRKVLEQCLHSHHLFQEFSALQLRKWMKYERLQLKKLASASKAGLILP